MDKHGCDYVRIMDLFSSHRILLDDLQRPGSHRWSVIKHDQALSKPCTSWISEETGIS